MPMPIEPDVRSALLPHNANIRRVIDEGFKAYVKRRGGGNLFRRTDAAEIFDCVVRTAVAELGKRNGIKIFKDGATARFLFDGKVLVRFKKANSKKMGQNIRTVANDNFIDAALPFGDAPAAMKVDVCWKVNALGTGFTNIFVTARDGKTRLWCYELPGGAQDVLKFPEKAPAAAPRKRIVKLKSGKEKKVSSEKS